METFGDGLPCRSGKYCRSGRCHLSRRTDLFLDVAGCPVGSFYIFYRILPWVLCIEKNWKMENTYWGKPWIWKQMNCKWLGVIYAIASIICYLGVVQVMSNSITESVTSVYSHVDFGLTLSFNHWRQSLSGVRSRKFLGIFWQS